MLVSAAAPDETDRLTPIQWRLIENSAAIRLAQPSKPEFLHSALCHVGFPRSQVAGRTFRRQNGNVSILLEAGSLYDGENWIEQPLPYGSIPRLIMIFLSSEAVRKQDRSIDLGDSLRQFLLRLGATPNGGRRGGYSAVRRQVEALAACRMTLGLVNSKRAVTIDAKPIQRFEAWRSLDAERSAIIELSESFFNSLIGHAVPLDQRAIASLKHSALALDIYAWLAQRLCRVRSQSGTKLSWTNLREQFGQEYACSKNFKREFRNALRQVSVAYPHARLDEVYGGIKLFPSQPPIAFRA